MATLHQFPAGGYAFLEGGYPYSQGVIAQPGFALHRVRFERPVPVSAGFDAIAAHLRSIGRPLTAFAACELRSPEPFSLDGFRGFNAGYREVLERWQLVREGLNPVARSNLAPRFDPPAEPCFHAFTYTVPDDAPGTAPQAADYVVAGSGEWPEDLPFPEGIVARGDVSPQGIARKAAYVLETMRARVEGLGGDIARATGVNVYTVHDFHPLIEAEFAGRGLLGHGLTLYPCRPPILELEFEMDLRSLRTERVIRAA
jgi:hypothetical protein